MDSRNREKFQYAGILRWHEMGFKGQDVKIATFERTTTDHGFNTIGVIAEAAPEAILVSRPQPTIHTVNNVLTAESKAALTDFYRGLIAEGVSIVTYSIGENSGYSPALAELEKQILVDEGGMVLFAAAGNDGALITRTAPAYYDHWYAVGACDLVNGRPRKAYYSNVDPKLDFMAFTGIYTPTGNQFYGTSASAPFAAAQWACIQSYALSQGRLFNPSEAKRLLISFCKDLGDPDFDNEHGHGILVLPQNPPQPIVEKYQIRMTIDSPFYTVNGESRKMDTAPFIKDGRTMVPVRFVAEGLDCDVQWIEKTREVIITQFEDS